MPAGTTLEDLAAASSADPLDLIQLVLDNIASPEDRTDFLQGLTERVLALRSEPGESAVTELHRWVGSWWISLGLLADPTFLAADKETQELLESGKLGEGVTGAELRARFGR
jgi:hypothetical protein